jgi:hypothetical protein
MRTLTRAGVIALFIIGIAGTAAPAWAQMHRGDMELFHYLLANRDKITREVTNLPNGIDTMTRSGDPEVAAKLKAHVASMLKRMEEGRPIHARDPLFAELFRNAKKVTVKYEPFAEGVHVVETSEDDYTVKLLHEHGRVVSLFIKNGMQEMHRDHPVPRDK